MPEAESGLPVSDVAVPGPSLLNVSTAKVCPLAVTTLFQTPKLVKTATAAEAPCTAERVTRAEMASVVFFMIERSGKGEKCW
jgi:hypothetical protein